MPVVVVPHEPGHADADGVLRAGDDAVGALGVVLEAEHQPCQRLRVHVRQPVGPYAPYAVACRGGQAAALPYLERGLEGHCDGPARGVPGDIWLVYPRAGQVKARRDAARVPLERGARAGVQAVGRRAAQHDVLDAPLPAEGLLLRVGAVLVDHEYVRPEGLHRGDEVHDAAAGVDERVLDVAYGPDHEQALPLGVHRAVVLVLQYRRVGADADIEVAVGRGLAEELHVPAVQEVIAPGHEHFPVCHCSVCWMFEQPCYLSALTGLCRKSS